MIKKSSEKQRWALRKLTIGMASVMLGTTLFVTVENNLPGVKNVVKASDTVVDSTTSGSVSDIIKHASVSSLYGANNMLSTIKYVGHTTTTTSDGKVQDVYTFLDYNENPQDRRVVNVTGIYGMNSNDIKIQFQASNASAQVTGSLYDSGSNSDYGASSQTGQYTAALSESTLNSNYVLVKVYITRVDSNTAAGFVGINGISQKGGSPTKPQISSDAVAASSTKSKAINPDTASDFSTATTADITIAQQTYKVGDNPTTVDADQASGTGSDKIKSITYTSTPDTSSATSEAKTAKATVTFNDGSTVSVDVPYVVTDIASTDGKDASVNDQTYKKGADVPDLKTSDVAGVDSDKVKSVEWVTKPNTDQDEGSYSDAKAKITFTDGSTKEVTVNYKITETSAQKITPNVPDKTEVDDKSNLSDTEKETVKEKVEDANKDVFPSGTEVSIGSDGTATITYPDGSTDTIPGSDLVTEKTKSDADKITPNVPDKTEVDDKSNLSDTEKETVKDKVEDANKDVFPSGTEVSIGSDGTATITYPDGSTDTIPGSDLVTEKTKSDADKITPNVPDKTEVDDKSNLTDSEKEAVKDKVEDANKDKFPSGTEVSIGSDGTATITYPDGSTDTIPGSDLVTEKTKSDDSSSSDSKSDDNTGSDTKSDDNTGSDSKSDDNTGSDTKSDDNTGSDSKSDDNTGSDSKSDDNTGSDSKSDDNTGSDSKSDDNTGSDSKSDDNTGSDSKSDDNTGSDSKSDDNTGSDSKSDDNTGSDSKSDDNTGSDSKSDDNTGESKSSTTEADKITPVVPDKTEVDDKSNLTDTEKEQVKDKVEDANKDNFPSGTEVSIGSDGTATISYPDGSKDTIPGSDLVTEKTKSDDSSSSDSKSDDNSGSDTKTDTTTDADKITPNVPDKTEVADKSNLTDSEKEAVKDKVEDANKDKFPSGTEVSIGSDGTATISYPDGSKDTISGSDLVTEKSDTTTVDVNTNGSSNTDTPTSSTTEADKIKPNLPEKTQVADTSNLTDAEKDEVKKAIEDANKDNFPSGTTVTVSSNGDATITYPDGSKDTISGSDLVVKKSSGNKAAAKSTSKSSSSSKKTPKSQNNQSSVSSSSNSTQTQNSSNSESGKLPQTGSNEGIFAIVGAILISLAAFMGFKKKEDK